jgi:hypothetical protein
MVLTLSACSAPAPDKTDTSQQNRQHDSADKFQQNVDPDPVTTDKPLVVSREDIKVQGGPACVFTIRYPGKIDHEVTWSNEPCSAVTVEFLNVGALKKFNKLVKLSAEAMEDVKRHDPTGVFYVESQFTASIFPLNVAGVPYELPVAD